MRKVTFIRLPDGTMAATANQLDMLFVDLGIPFNSVFADGKAHPGTRLNGIVELLYQPKYAKAVDPKALVVLYADSNNRANAEFISSLTKCGLINKQSVHEGKLDLYPLACVLEIIKYLCADAKIRVPQLDSEWTIMCWLYKKEMPAFRRRELCKKSTAASSLFDASPMSDIIEMLVDEIAQQEAKGFDQYNRALSSFSADEQAVIKEFERRFNTIVGNEE